jgi:hypothetical protein
MSGRIERIVVPFDVTFGETRRHRHRGPPGCPPKAQLRGVSIEDEDLLHLADQSFARQATVTA